MCPSHTWRPTSPSTAEHRSTQGGTGRGELLVVAMAARQGSREGRFLMKVRTAVAAALVAALIVVVALVSGAAGAPRDDALVDAIEHASRSTPWEVVRRVPLDFQTYHPQGFARVGDRLYMSSVEIIEAPQKYPQPVG